MKILGRRMKIWETQILIAITWFFHLDSTWIFYPFRTLTYLVLQKSLHLIYYMSSHTRHTSNRISSVFILLYLHSKQSGRAARTFSFPFPSRITFLHVFSKQFLTYKYVLRATSIVVKIRRKISWFLLCVLYSMCLNYSHDQSIILQKKTII